MAKRGTCLLLVANFQTRQRLRGDGCAREEPGSGAGGSFRARKAGVPQPRCPQQLHFLLPLWLRAGRSISLSPSFFICEVGGGGGGRVGAPLIPPVGEMLGPVGGRILSKRKHR